ncbi:hypothetical protein C8F01DRAFT_1083261 [Mycena amicta]|nr:hypothetical protein C8F01DRAFT_1083261 [Mycena amicta]
MSRCDASDVTVTEAVIQRKIVHPAQNTAGQDCSQPRGGQMIEQADGESLETKQAKKDGGGKLQGWTRTLVLPRLTVGEGGRAVIASSERQCGFTWTLPALYSRVFCSGSPLPSWLVCGAIPLTLYDLSQTLVKTGILELLAARSVLDLKLQAYALPSRLWLLWLLLLSVSAQRIFKESDCRLYPRITLSSAANRRL